MNPEMDNLQNEIEGEEQYQKDETLSHIFAKQSFF